MPAPVLDQIVLAVASNPPGPRAPVKKFVGLHQGCFGASCRHHVIYSQLVSWTRKPCRGNTTKTTKTTKATKTTRINGGSVSAYSSSISWRRGVCCTSYVWWRFSGRQLTYYRDTLVNAPSPVWQMHVMNDLVSLKLYPWNGKFFSGSNVDALASRVWQDAIAVDDTGLFFEHSTITAKLAWPFQDKYTGLTSLLISSVRGGHSQCALVAVMHLQGAAICRKSMRGLTWFVA